MQIKNRAFAAIVALLALASPALPAGSLPVALQTVIDINGRPQVGALLYFYQVGTVATKQDSFQDTGLTVLNQWPLPTDAFGRVPMFYLADGSVHVRLTDSGGAQIFDYPNMLVIGPSGGGGGGSSVDPTTIASTGDVKFRLTSEALTGWVKLNALNIGSAVSGATGRANSDTQALFIYLWTNCPNAHCAVSGGRGGTALADFNANKTVVVPDCRGRICAYGLDDMGSTPAGRLLAANVTSGGGDTVTTPNATGGTANVQLSAAMAPVVPFAGTAINLGTLNVTPQGVTPQGVSAGGGGVAQALQGGTTFTVTIPPFTPAGTVNAASGGTALTPTVSPFALGTYYMKL